MQEQDISSKSITCRLWTLLELAFSGTIPCLLGTVAPSVLGLGEMPPQGKSATQQHAPYSNPRNLHSLFFFFSFSSISVIIASPNFGSSVDVCFLWALLLSLPFQPVSSLFIDSPIPVLTSSAYLLILAAHQLPPHLPTTSTSSLYLWCAVSASIYPPVDNP